MEKQRNKNRIEKVVICHELDESPDTSTLGKYTSRRDTWNIDRKTGEYVNREEAAERIICSLAERIETEENDEKVNRLQLRMDKIQALDFSGNIGWHEHQYFEPYAGGEKKGTPDYKKNGKQDYERMEGLNNGNWYPIGIIAKAEIYVNNCRQTITSGGLWGMESDSDKEYIREEEKNQLADLSENLFSLGFGIRAVKYAIKNHEVKE
jgi:hypothetical protein